jgi:hypothetical protein
MDIQGLTLLGLIIQCFPTGIPAWAFGVYYAILLVLHFGVL